MKKLFLFTLAFAFVITSMAQAPGKMSYQAVVRNAANELVKSSDIGMRISILKDSPSGTAVYVETQTPKSNDNGLISIEIGSGTIVSGVFANINWAKGTYFIKTETDPAGGTNYTITGTSQLLSVPYALHAKTTGGIAPDTELMLSNTTDSSKLYLTPPGNTATGGLGTSTNHGLYFFTNNVDRAVFTASGKYGFGTLNPTSPFHIADGNAEIRLQNTQSNASLYLTAPAPGSTGGIGTSTSHGLYFFTNNRDRAVITADGWYGLGTSNPSSPIHLLDSNAELRLENPRSQASLYLTAPAPGSTGGLGTSSNHGLYFFTNNVDRAVFTPTGKFGFGTLNPASKVSVGGGDVQIEDIGAGIIMKSPNGSCWKVTINNSGVLTSTQITCP